MNVSHMPTKRATYTLTGHSFVGDKRTTPIRGDLADIKLAGKLFAPHYAIPMIRSCHAPSAQMFEAADASSTATSELVYGEQFAVLDVAGNWAWGYGLHDDYLGYVALDALGAVIDASHVVTSVGAIIFEAPQIRTPVVRRLPMGAKLRCTALSECGAFYATDEGFVPISHVTKIGEVAGTPADIAEHLVGTPYLWGGRSGDALDCSGLVQLTFGLVGIMAPRDSDMQMAAMGVGIFEGDALRRNDLIFFPGHVGIMADADTLIHANFKAIQVKIEPLIDVAARFSSDPKGPILARKRVAL